MSFVLVFLREFVTNTLLVLGLFVITHSIYVIFDVRELADFSSVESLVKLYYWVILVSTGLSLKSTILHIRKIRLNNS